MIMFWSNYTGKHLLDVVALFLSIWSHMMPWLCLVFYNLQLQFFIVYFRFFRSNSSILGQKKKNQRKKTNKKRAQERRCSESEASEAEDKKEREEEEDTRERDGEKTNTVEEVVEKKEEDFSADVFQLDMYFWAPVLQFNVVNE